MATALGITGTQPYQSAFFGSRLPGFRDHGFRQRAYASATKLRAKMRRFISQTSDSNLCSATQPASCPRYSATSSLPSGGA